MSTANGPKYLPPPHASRLIVNAVRNRFKCNWHRIYTSDSRRPHIMSYFIHICSPVYITQLLNHLQHSLMTTLSLTSPSSFVNKSLVIYDIEFFYNKNRCSLSRIGCFSLHCQSEGFGCNKGSKFVIIIHIIVPSSHLTIQLNHGLSTTAVYRTCTMSNKWCRSTTRKH